MSNSNEFEMPENVEQAFQDLDKKKHKFFASPIWAYMQALQEEGFTREEAFKLVEQYSKFMYELALEDFITNGPVEDNDVDSDDEEE